MYTSQLFSSYPSLLSHCCVSFVTVIFIGFEQQRYTVFEADADGTLTLIPVLKANNQESELQFLLVAQISDRTTQIGSDYLAVTRSFITFSANQQFINVQSELLPDVIPEDEEEFTIELTTSGDAPRIMIGGSLFGRTTVVIIDDDG